MGSQRSIQRWVRQYREQGLAGLKSGWDGQNAAKLSRQQRAEIKQRLQQSSPNQVLASNMRIESGDALLRLEVVQLLQHA